jgi:hypothetical protein
MLILGLATLIVFAACLFPLWAFNSAMPRDPGRPGLLFFMLWAGFLCATMPYCVSKTSPSALHTLCLRLWLGLAVVCWVSRDRRGHAYPVPFEYDAFMLAAWPILLPHYLVRTRGREGAMLTIWLYAPLAVMIAFYVLFRAITPTSIR